MARWWRRSPEYAEKALAYADEMLERLVVLAADSEAVKLGAIKEVLKRTLGKSPEHGSVPATPV